MTVPGAQTLHIQAGVGFDESRREELINPGEANIAQTNVRLDKLGALKHRLGHSDMNLTRPDETTPSAPRALFAHGNQLARISSDYVDSYEPSTGRWWNRGSAPDALVTRIPVAAPDLGNTGASLIEFSPSIAYAEGVYAVACLVPSQTTGNKALIVYFVERSTGQTIIQHLVSNDVAKVKLVASGSVVWAVYTDNATTSDIFAARFSVGSAALIATAPTITTIVSADFSANESWDACATETQFVVAYENLTAGAARITIKTFVPLTAGNTAIATVATAGAVRSIAVDGSDSDFIWVAHITAAANTVRVEGRSPTTLAVTSSQIDGLTGAALMSRAVVTRFNSTSAYLGGDYDNATVSTWTTSIFGKVTSAAGVTASAGSPAINPGWTNYADPIVVGTRAYQVGALDTGDSRYEIAVFDGTNFANARALRPVANPVRNLAFYDPTDVTIQRPAMVSSTIAAVCLFTRRNNAAASFDIVEMDFDSTRRWRTAQHNGITYLSGGCVYGYDGYQLFEASYIAPPSIRATRVAGGGSLSAGTYVYMAIYEWVDAAGNVHWSEPSAVQSPTGVLANDSVTVQALYTTATCKDQYALTGTSQYRRLRIKIYRTVAGGGEYYLLTTLENSMATVYGGTHIATYTDVTSDSGLVAGAKAYRHPGLRGTAQARMAPPPALDICEYSNGLAVIAEDARTLWLTAQNVPGEGAWWNPIFQYDIAPGLVACREMDGQLFVWSRTGIYVSSGNLPVDNGRDGGLGQFRRLSADVGCLDARSIVRTQYGYFFQSARGIELLSRSGEVVWIGQQVQETLETYPIITSAVHDTFDDCVLFTCTADLTEGVTLVFDLTTQAWVSIDTIASPAPATSAAIWSATMAWSPNEDRFVYVMLDASGYVLARDGTISDAGTNVASTWTTPWLKLGLQHEHQFWDAMLLFQRDGAASLSALLTYDWDASVETKSWTSTEIGTYYRQVEMRPKSNIQAFKVKFTATPTGGSAGISFIGLSVDLAVEQREDGSLPHIAVLARK